MTSARRQQLGKLSAELELLALRAIVASYEDINRTLFDAELRTPAFELTDTVAQLGHWRGDVRTLALSRSLLEAYPWGDLVEVLKHEMAHQYVQEVLGAAGETSHGKAYREVCARRGIDSRAAGPPSSSGEKTDDKQPILKKIARLLALAESDSEHEAQLAMNTAQRLMLKYNLESVADSSRSYCFRHLGAATGRVNEGQRRLALILSDHFFVEVIWVPVWRALEGKRGSVIEVCGTRENVELAEYVYWFLSNTADRLWRDHRKRNGIRQNRDRLSFIAGVIAGFGEKLQFQKKEALEHGLVWSGDAELRSYLKQRHPHVRWTSYRTSSRTEAHSQGRAAGRTIILHKGVKAGAGGGPKLLGPANG